MTRERFKRNLVQALEHKDQYVSDRDMEKFLDLNYDEDGNWDWDYDIYTNFASEMCRTGNFWKAVKQFDLHYVGEEEEDD